MNENTVKFKSFNLALEVIKNYKEITTNHREFVLSKQFLRSGTVVGALIREAENAESKKDFIHKLSISLKEANETDYWIELIYQSKYFTIENYLNLKSSNSELVRMLTSIIKTTKNNLKQPNY
jgi:four helix bundle protein